MPDKINVTITMSHPELLNQLQEQYRKETGQNISKGEIIEMLAVEKLKKGEKIK